MNSENHGIAVTKRELSDYFVNYHGFDEFYGLNRADALESIFARLRSVQFDPLNVVGRNAELVLFSRNAHVTRGDLYDALYKTRTLVDGWDKMMCIYGTHDFTKLKFVRDAAERQYDLVMQWRGQTECHAYMDSVLSYITEHGATFASDIPSEKTNRGGWGNSRIAGVCCEYLWHGGRLCVAAKKGAVKSFDLTERLIGVDPQVNAFADKDEFLRWYVKRRLSAVGAARLQNGGAWLGHYLEDAELRKNVVDELTERGEITPVTVIDIKGKNNVYYINSSDKKFFMPTKRKRAVFVAPLDNLLWDRKTLKSVFDFDYSWEVYAPQSKRKFGYYVLPILMGNRLIGRIEPIADRTSSRLTLKNIWFEADYSPAPDDVELIEAELKRLAEFLAVAPDPTAKAKIVQALPQ